MALVKPPWPILRRGHPLARGLVSAWPLSEGADLRPYPATVLNDLSFILNHGSLPASGVTWSGGPFGSALSFSGNPGMMYTTHDWGAHPFNGTFTYSIWFKTSVTSTYQFLIGISGSTDGYTGTNAGTQDGFMWVGSDSVLHCGCYDTISHQISTAGSVADGKWHHAVMRCSGSSAGFDLILDGVYVAFSGGGNYAGYPNSYLNIGGQLNVTGWTGKGAPGDGHFLGSLDGILVYNRVIDLSEVAQLYYDPFVIYRRPSHTTLWNGLVSGGPQTLTAARYKGTERKPGIPTFT